MDQAAPAKVMVIGDDSHFCYLMRRYIRQSAHQIAFAYQGEDVLDIAHREKPAAIILEVDHPGSAGWLVLKALKSDELTSCIPVVLCSWRDDNDADLRKADHKAEIYLQKPILYADFKAALDQLGIHSEAE